jgi:voltage-gated potassium channel
MSSNPAGGPRGTAYELFVLLLSLLSIFNAILILLPFLSGAGREVVIVMETLLTPVFLVDFLLRLNRSRPRSAYLLRAFGWADLLAIIPMLRVFRLFRVAVVVRHLRAAGPARIAEDLSVTRAAATFFTTIFLVIVVLELSGMLILDAESGIQGANIRTPSDALWWGYVTITTVGYGDRYPVTLPGRIIGIFLLTAGVALFSVFTGFVANAFLAPRRRPLHRLRGARPSGALAELQEIRHLVSEQDDRTRELHARIDALERELVATRDATAAGGTAAGEATAGGTAAADADANEDRAPAR